MKSLLWIYSWISTKNLSQESLVNDFSKKGVMLSIMLAIPFRRSFLFRPWAHHFHLWFLIQRVLPKSQNFYHSQSRVVRSFRPVFSNFGWLRLSRLPLAWSPRISVRFVPSPVCSVFSCLLCLLLLVFLTSW